MLIAFSSSAMTAGRGASEKRWYIDSLGKWSCVSWLISISRYTNNASHSEYICLVLGFPSKFTNTFIPLSSYSNHSLFLGKINTFFFFFGTRILSTSKLDQKLLTPLKFTSIPCLSIRSYQVYLICREKSRVTNIFFERWIDRRWNGGRVSEGHVVEGRLLSILWKSRRSLSRLSIHAALFARRSKAEIRAPPGAAVHSSSRATEST